MKLWNNLRYSARTLRREPVFAIVAVLTIALGIGANTAIFSVVDAVLLRPLPGQDPQKLVSLREVMPAVAQKYPTFPVSARHFAEFRQRAKCFERLSAIDTTTATLSTGHEPLHLDIARVSADFFQTIGVLAAAGRTFHEGEDQDGNNGIAILTSALWRRQFNSDQAVVGRTIRLNGRPVTIVGVLPEWFQCPSLRVMETGKSDATRPELFVPLVFTKEEMGILMGRFNYNVIARLKPGITLPAAAADVNLVAGQLVKMSGEDVELRGLVTPLLDSMVGQSRRGLVVLLGAVGAVLLIVCVNLANLMLARGERHARESAIRTALGAGARRLIAQALTEALLLAFLGGMLGVTIAAGSLNALVRYAPADLPRADQVGLDSNVLLFAFAITTATGLLFGLAPAWRAARTDPQNALKSGGRSSTGSRGGQRVRGALVAAEVGLSTVLLVTAGLLMSSFFRVMHSDKGFDAPSVLAADVQIPSAQYKEDAQRSRFFERTLAGVAAQPGVVSAAVVSALPLQGEIWIDDVAVPGDSHNDWQKPTANIRFISPDYFRTMGILLRSGRPFRGDDRRDVVVVSESLARVLWPGQDATGRKLLDGGDVHEVVGVAADVRVEPDKPPVFMVYRPYWDWPSIRAILVARAAGDPRTIAGAMRAAVRGVDPEVPLANVRTMREVLDQSVAQRRFQMRLSAAFAAAALLLAALGIYGVVSYSTTRRTGEIGLRLALGAQGHQIYRMVLRQAMTPVALGLAIGLGGSVAIGRVLAGLLYQVSPRDPELLAVAAALLALVGLSAAILPAHRALRTDPLDALCAE